MVTVIAFKFQQTPTHLGNIDIMVRLMVLWHCSFFGVISRVPCTQIGTTEQRELSEYNSLRSGTSNIDDFFHVN